MGNIVQSSNIATETNNPKLVPKKDLNTAPVYPKRADISNFNKISVLDKSMGLNIVATKEYESNG